MIEQKSASLFAPVLLLALALVVWFAFQASQLYHERSQLAKLRGNQDVTYQNAQKMRNQLDSLAAGTQKLASAGNKNARCWRRSTPHGWRGRNCRSPSLLIGIVRSGA